MSGIRLNVAALVGSFVLLAVSALVDPAIEDRARAGGGWNTAYLVVPCLQGILTVMSLVGLSLSLRHRQFLDPVIMTAMVVLSR